MRLDNKTFAEKTSIQGACEASVASYFLAKRDFKIEVRVNPSNKKNVDCKFKSGRFTAAFDSKEQIEKLEGFKFQTAGRIDNRQDLFEELQKAIKEGLSSQNKPSAEFS